MSSDDETYLEGFIESIATLPNDIRRNLELMKTLDRSFATINNELKHAKESYVKNAEETILNLLFPKEGTIPITTEELESLTYQTKLLSQIECFRNDARQYSDEKVSVVEQTCDFLDATLKRLDDDFAQFEA